MASPLPQELLKFKPVTPSHYHRRRCKPNLSPLATTLIALVYAAALVCSLKRVSHGELAEAAAWLPSSAAQMASDVIAIKEGADLDLSCPIVVQNEDMIISWTCDNEPANIKSSRIHVTESGKLRIRSAKVGDSCNYRCEAADGFGTLSMLIKVIIVDKNLMEKLNRGKSSSVGAIAGSAALENQTFASGKGNQQAAAATRRRPSAQATSAPTAAASGGHHSELSTSAAATASAVNEKIINDPANHLRAHKVSSISAKFAAPEATRGSGGSEQADDLQVQMDTMRTNVQVNKTFSLECQVKYGHKRVPQIIWLKEFIGRQPESLNEAHDQNLILIDNVYYHSLNWPRSLSYSKETSSANSALLIRQAKPVHSGRYICLAGYQPSMTLNSGSLSSSKVTNNDNHASLVSSAAQLKYKMDMTNVEVEDRARPDGDDIWPGSASSSFREVPKAYATAGGAGGPNTGWSNGNLLISIFSSNSLTRNLTLLIILLIGLLLLLKFVVYPYYKLSRTTSGKANGNSNNNSTGPLPVIQQTNFLAAQLERPQDATALTVIKTTRASNYGNSLQTAPLPKLPPKQLQLKENAVVRANQGNEADQAANNSNAIKPTTGNLETNSQCNKQQQLKHWPSDNHCKNDDVADEGDDDDDKHLYSEIGERDNKALNLQTAAEEAASESYATSSESNNIYKVPNKLIGKIN